MRKKNEASEAMTKDEVTYVRRYSEECSPINLKVAAAINGIKTADLNKPFTYLDVGCGNAVSLCAFAAANPNGHFIGIDPNVRHIKYAQQLVDACSLENVTLINKTVQDVDMDDVPDCDFIVANAFISNVDDDARYRLLEIIDAKLKKQGVYLAVYNTLPGWNVLLPMHELISHGLVGEDPDVIKELNKNVYVVDELIRHQAAFFKDSVDSVRVFDAIKSLSANAVVHEFMDESVEAFYFREVVEYQASAGLGFLGSAILHKNYYAFVIPDRFESLLSSLPNRIQKERLMDFIENTRVRSDVFMSEAAIKKQDHHDESVFNDVFVLCTMTDEQLQRGVSLKHKNFKLNDPESQAIIALVKEDSMSVKSLLVHKSLKQFKKADIFNRVKIMLALKCLTPCVKKFIKKSAKPDPVVKKRIEMMNLQLFNIAQSRKMPVPLLSEVTAAGVWTSLPIAKLLLALSASDGNIERAWELVLQRSSGNALKDIKNNKEKVVSTLSVLKKKRLPIMQQYGMYV